MSKKIIILNGSPRAKGNTTGLIDAFTEGAKEAGHEVSSFLLDQMNISGCKGCFGGGKDPKSPCAIKDDMDKIYPDFKESDVVVMASPLYFWNMSGQLRVATDRLFAVMEGDETYTKTEKECVLLMVAEGQDFDMAADYFDYLMEKMNWVNRGKVLAGKVNMIGDIQGKSELDDARKLGMSM